MNTLFERNRSDWCLSITSREVMHCVMAIGNMWRMSTEKSVVWITKVSPTRRLWIIRDRHTLVWIAADASPDDPRFALPVPEQLVHEMASFVGGEDITLYCDEVDDIIVCKSGERYIAVDHPRDVEFGEFDLPYIGGHGTDADGYAVAEVSAEDLHTFAHSASSVPSRLEFDLGPFVRVAMGDGALRWTMDWRRFGLWQMTRSVPARTVGVAEVSFYPWTVARVLRALDTSDDVTVYAGGPDAEYVYFVGSEWGARVVNDTGELARWHSSLARALAAARCEVPARDSERIPTVLGFVTPRGSACTAIVMVNPDGAGESVRFTHVVASDVHPTPGVLARINQLNAELVGATVVLRSGQVQVVVEFDAQSISPVEAPLQALDDAISQCERSTSFLPLFGDPDTQ